MNSPPLSSIELSAPTPAGINGRGERMSLLRRSGQAIAELFLFRSFLAHFWWSLFCLSVIGAVLYVYVVAHVWGRFVDMRTQRVHWMLATNLKREIQPQIDAAASDQELIKELSYLSGITPMFDIYIYDAERGSLLGTEGRREVEIDTAPLEEFLRQRSYPLKPLLLDATSYEQSDVRQDRTFSAARLSLEGRPGYLIAILGGKRYIKAIDGLGRANLPRLGHFLFGSIVMITTVTGHLLFYLLNRRFSHMTKVVREFQSGDLSQRVGDTSADEVGEYARAFDRMADTIVETMDELQRVDEQRRKLVANVAHELRRPLSMLALSLETLAQQDQVRCSPEERRRFIAQALDGCETLTRLIADLFELSKLNAVETAPNIEPCDLHELAHDIVVQFEPRAVEAGVKLSVEYPEGLPSALADVGLIERALSNLIDNAIRYCAAGNSVTVAISTTDALLRVEISDDGPGIAQEDLPGIFDRFYRGRNARQMQVEGAGLGLAIAKRIIEVHGGQLQVTSIPYRQTTFSFELPTAAEA